MVGLENGVGGLEERFDALEAGLRKELREIRERLGMETGESEPDRTLNILRGYVKTAKTGFAVVYAGLIKKDGRETGRWCFRHLTDKYEDYLKSIDPRYLKEFLASFMNEQRIQILRQLTVNNRPTSANELSKATGIAGGHLYHHLDQLMEARYVAKTERGLYEVTWLGMATLFAITVLIRNLKSWKEKGRGAEPETARL